jgi:hypothetical protein
MRLPVIAVTALACLLLASQPCSAQSLFSRETEDRQGFLVSLEWFSATTGGGAFEYATLNTPEPPVPGVGGGGGGEILSVEFDAEAALRLGLGWDFGRGRGTLALRHWSTDSTVSDGVDTGINSLQIGEILIPPTFFAGRVDAAFAEATVEVDVTDLEYGMDIGRSRRGNGYWRIGLRSSSIDQAMNVEYWLQGAIIDQATITSKVEGFGPAVGVGGRINLGRRVRLAGDLGLAYMLGDADYRGDWLVSETTLFDVQFTLVDENRDHNHLQLEGSAGVAVRAWKDLEVTVGYRFLNFQDVVRRARFVDDVDVNVVVFAEDDLTVDGPFVMVSWTAPLKLKFWK